MYPLSQQLLDRKSRQSCDVHDLVQDEKKSPGVRSLLVNPSMLALLWQVRAVMGETQQLGNSPEMDSIQIYS